jgi:hypothetical protein
MKHKFLTYLFIALFLGICLSITEINTQRFCLIAKEKGTPKVLILESTPDVLNPIYILK